MAERAGDTGADGDGGAVTVSSVLDLSFARIWIVSAWRPEQNWLIRILSQHHELVEHDEHLSLCGPYAFIRTGVGTVRAAIMTSRLLAQAESQGSLPEAVWFVATAGSYSDHFKMEQAFFANDVKWTDGDLLSGAAYLPALAGGVEQILSDFKDAVETPVSVVCTPAITLSETLASALGRQGQLENLELYGVALAARQIGVRWGAVLGVSNCVGPQAHSEWKAHHEKASESAQILLYETILRSRL
ncbi:MAG: hypothetical protein RIR26_2928 [Pseudomonadota bacterium]|jgi:purine-nucleoside phosphorylase